MRAGMRRRQRAVVEKRFDLGARHRQPLAEPLEVDERRAQVVRHAVDECFVVLGLPPQLGVQRRQLAQLVLELRAGAGRRPPRHRRACGCSRLEQ